MQVLNGAAGMVGIDGGGTAAPLATVMVAAAVVALAGQLAAGGRRSRVTGG
ncbi:hypothetical protein [Kocuria sabuli]|uniref:hypothetical protein n=1 Tax=Kocuria sabuli TaxID=3071448 RepID=UPI0034D68213